jgi:DNA-binding GntR family transcriptional regulator
MVGGNVVEATMTETIKRRRGRPRIERPLWGTGYRLANPALHVRAVDALRDLIVRGALKGGERIAEAAVCEALGLSRTPLREALKLLAAEGLVELHPNRGATVTPLRLPEVTALFEAVSGIEQIAAELAAQRLTTAELEQLQTLQDRLETFFYAGTREEYFQINQEIHRAIVAGAKNPVLVATHGWLLARVQRARYLALHTPERWAQSVTEHRAILAALAARNAAQAGQLLAAHVRHTGDAVAATLAPAGRDAVAAA